MKDFILVWIVLWGVLAFNALAKAETVKPDSGMKVTQNAALASGKYRMVDTGGGVVQVSGSGFTVDFGGAKLRGQSDENAQSTIFSPPPAHGIGLHITDARNITIKNADISGYLWGVVIERSAGVKLINCTTSRNANLPPGIIIDESGREPEDTHGGGILIRDSRDCMVQQCVSQWQWDGIDVVRSENNVIADSDFSFNGNWGLHLWNSSRNTFRNNRAVWCTTGQGMLYQALTGWQTYDAQAVGIDHNSNENVIEGNDLRFGGDAIFIRANEGPIAPGSVVPPRNGSHRNVLRNNDCSFSPNNAIEVDLVDDTVIEGNNCSFSNYGMWLGYSRRCVVRNNICINDSAHAVEIENGQDDVFENNVFGWDTPRPDAPLVYLRQNERDKTPSAGYKFNGNVFYGGSSGVRLHRTQAQLSGNAFMQVGAPFQEMTIGDKDSQFKETDTHRPVWTRDDGRYTLSALVGGKEAALAGRGLRPNGTPPVVEINGIPVWIKEATNTRAHFWLPADFWNRPAAQNVQVRVFAFGSAEGADRGAVFTEVRGSIAWPPDDQPRIEEISPNPARIGDTITLAGANLNGPDMRVLFNGRPAVIVRKSDSQLQLKLPEGILTPVSYNIVVQKGVGENTLRSRPVTFAVDVPREQMPHLTSAAFSPTTLRAGELLKVTFTVRNNLPTSAFLMQTRQSPFTYEEKQSAGDMGLSELPNHLHLRVTSDHPGPHDPGSWPYLFGFDKAVLAPGETTTVTGYIRVETPGTHEFRVGLVAGGFHFIDDNAFRTKITVLPHP